MHRAHRVIRGHKKSRPALRRAALVSVCAGEALNRYFVN
jgi:hypothetical protein